VILLSTDKEIGPKEVLSLQEHVTRTYLVRHNEQTKVSDLTEGYFN
jgi:DNA sulfur modification protein DndD